MLCMLHCVLASCRVTVEFLYFIALSLCCTYCVVVVCRFVLRCVLLCRVLLC